jgi:hypothetical protein
MLVWLISSIGLGLLAALAASIVLMLRAERRARQAFYRSLGYSEDLIAALMAPGGPVAAQLALVRKTASEAGLLPEEMHSLSPRPGPRVTRARPAKTLPLGMPRAGRRRSNASRD